MALLFLSCEDSYKRVGNEAKENVFPQGEAEDFVLTYTEAPEKVTNQDEAQSKVVAILTSPLSKDFENLRFPYRTFPKGLQLEFFDDNGNKSTITADYGIIYALTHLIDLQGNVVVESYDGKKIESPQLYWDRVNDWVLTQEKFKYTNPEEGTVMYGEGMDVKRDLTLFKAQKTNGVMSIKEEE